MSSQIFDQLQFFLYGKHTGATCSPPRLLRDVNRQFVLLANYHYQIMTKLVSDVFSIHLNIYGKHIKCLCAD